MIMTLEEFIQRNGTETFRLFVESFIRKAPEFEGDQALAMEIGRIMGDLDSVFADHERSRES
jgi:hypothetical protein